MRKLLVSAAILMSSTMIGHAADIAYKSPKVVVTDSSTYDWSGFYAGVFGGGVFGNHDTVTSAGTLATTFRPNGAVFGGFLGYNYQFGSMVFGVEGSFGFAGGKAETDYSSNGNTRVNHYAVERTYDGQLRGRIGYAFDTVLPFVAGGASFSDAKVTVQGVSPATTAFSGRKDEVGWNIGAGVDWAVSKNAFVRFEYLHEQFSGSTIGFNDVSLGSFRDRNIKDMADVVRVGAAYKF